MTVTVSFACGEVAFEHVTFGFNGGYKAGKWAPLNVTLRSQNEPASFTGELAVEVRNVFSGERLQRYATPLQLSTTDRRHRQLYVYCPKIATKLTVQVVRTEARDQAQGTSNPATIATKEILPPTPIASKDYFVLVLAPSGDKLKPFIDKKQLDNHGAQGHVSYLPNSRALPTQWIGYSAVDVLVMREVLLTERRVSKAQQTAMLDWVQRGGTLVTSGGSNFNYLKGSFIEPFLPVKLKGVETVDIMPDALREQLGFQHQLLFSGGNRSLFERIQFVPRAGCETLLGTSEQIYVAKRNFGDGQILCLAFDYNAPPFGVSQKQNEKPEQQVGENFWQWLLKNNGKSPRHLEDRYAPYRRHEEEIHKQFLLKMPTQLPLIKLLSIALPIYLLSFGGGLVYFGKRGQASQPLQKRARGYWIGSCLFVLVSVSAIGVARNVLPKSIAADKLSILSVYPERQRAHLQSYVSLRATAPAKTSIELTQSTFIRSLVPDAQHPLQLIQGLRAQIRATSVEPWSPSTYLKEVFFELDPQQSPIKLENAWSVTGDGATYLGNITTENSNLEIQHASGKTSKKIPPHEGLQATRKAFAQILQREGVLRYLAKTENRLPAAEGQNWAVWIGWTSQAFSNMAVDGNATAYDETLVIFRPGAER